MTDNKRNVAQWVAIALTLLFAIGSTVSSSTTIGNRATENEKTNVNQEVKITAIKEVVNDHSVQLAVIPNMQEDIKEIKADQKQSTEIQNKMMSALVRIETKLEEMEKKK